MKAIVCVIIMPIMIRSVMINQFKQKSARRLTAVLSFLCLALVRPAASSFINHLPKDRWYSSSAKFDASHESGSAVVRSQKPLETEATELQMLSFYRFVPVENPAEARDELFSVLQDIPGLRGTLYIAQEGVNAQLAVPRGEPLDRLLEACVSQLPFDPFESNPPNMGDVVPIETPTFNRLIVRTRDAILRDGMGEDLDWDDAGLELSPAQWDTELRTSNSVVLLDCRNTYESEKGSFLGATPLETQTFQESWDELESKTRGVDKDQPLHIYCTGGIRCVKVGSYLKQKLGFSDVRRLEHGIIGYQRWAKDHVHLESDSVWEGQNFVFDKRRSSENKN